MDNKLVIVNYLGKHPEQLFTMHELSKLVKIPYATFYRTVSEMSDLIILKRIGKSKIIELNKSNAVIRSYLAVSSEEEKKEFLRKQPLISKIANELSLKDIVVLFGSYAKGSEKNSSDIDLLIINAQGNKTLSFSKYETLFKKKVNPLFITKKEFSLMLKEKDENVGKQALKNHIILNNPEAFWECALNGWIQTTV